MYERKKIFSSHIMRICLLYRVGYRILNMKILDTYHVNTKNAQSGRFLMEGESFFKALWFQPRSKGVNNLGIGSDSQVSTETLATTKKSRFPDMQWTIFFIIPFWIQEKNEYLLYNFFYINKKLFKTVISTVMMQSCFQKNKQSSISAHPNM